MAGPYAIRVRTPDGWQDLALVGPAGATGPGVPAGGATGLVLAKASATDYNTAWVPPLPSALLSALPSTPYDGQIIQLAPGSGVIWLFRYLLSTPAWYYIGGAPYFVEDDTDSAVAAGYTAKEPHVNLLYRGLYEVTAGFEAYTPSGVATVQTQIAGAGSPLGSATSQDLYMGTAASSYVASFKRRVQFATAGDVYLFHQYVAGSTGVPHIRKAWLSAVPIWIST